MKKKIILNINPPRSGGKALMLLDCFMKANNALLWPFEFHYFTTFNQAVDNKKIGDLNKINFFFENKYFNKFFEFIKKNKKNYINIKKFKKKLYQNKKKKFSSLDYLSHIFECYNDSLKKKKKKIKYFIINTTARGFDWHLNKKYFIFLKTDRNLIEGFNSLKNKNLESENLKNFFSLSGKKSFFYWLYIYKKIENKISQINEKQVINLKFENIKFSKKQKIIIKKENIDKILKKTKILINKKIKGYYFSINRKKNKKKIKFTRMELYCLNNLLIKKNNLEFLKYLKNYFLLIFDIKFLIKGKNYNFINIFFIFFNFAKYFFVYKNEKKLIKIFKKNNSFINYEPL